MTDQKPLNIILLGDPAAGKATQSALLCKKFKLIDLDMGKELRRIKNKELRSRYNLKDTLEKGRLTPTQLVRGILEDKITSAPQFKGILFDGTPKMLGEAKLVYKWLKQQHRKDPIVIYLSVPVSETMRRMSDRKEYFRGKFSKRADDNDKALKNRIAYYRKNISEVINFFQTKYKFKKISGLGSREEVSKKIMEFLLTNE